MQIKLLTLDSSGHTLAEQMAKIDEEFREVIDCYFDYKDLNTDKEIAKRELQSELIDLMQACKTMLEILETDIQSVNERHIAKLKQRAAEGKIKLLEDDGE